jgi:hypothetical protein
MPTFVNAQARGSIALSGKRRSCSAESGGSGASLSANSATAAPRVVSAAFRLGPAAAADSDKPARFQCGDRDAIGVALVAAPEQPTTTQRRASSWAGFRSRRHALTEASVAMV